MKNTKTSKKEQHEHAVFVCSIIGKRGGIGPHTLKEILQSEEPDFWNEANECVEILRDWQIKTVERLPFYRNNLPKNIEQIENEYAHTYLNYIKLRSIFGLADYLWQSVDGICHNLAEELNTCDEDREIKIAMIKQKSNQFFEFIKELPIFDITQDDVTGFYRLYRHCFWEKSDQHLHFVVFSNIYLFISICDDINKCGIKAESLWDEVSKSQDPTASSITGLMEKPEDNKMVRVY